MKSSLEMVDIVIYAMHGIQELIDDVNYEIHDKECPEDYKTILFDELENYERDLKECEDLRNDLIFRHNKQPSIYV